MTRRGVAFLSLPCLAISLLAAVRSAAAEPDGDHRPPGAPAGDEPPFRCKAHPGPVVVTFKADAEVKDLIAWAVGFTCKNVLLDPRIAATGRRISIVTPSQMSPDDAYQVFLAALATINLTVVPRGNTLRVVEASGAHKEAVPLLHAGTPGDTDQYVRYVYKPSFVVAEQLRQAYEAMKSDAGNVFTLGQVVVMTDYGSQVRAMLAFARLVDVPGGSDGIYTLPVRHADAGKLTEKLNAILNLTPGAAPVRPAPDPGKPDAGRSTAAAVPSKIVVDERTNTLILASSEAGYQRVQALVERLDVALEMEGGSAIHVVPLGSAIAEELARTLTQATGDGRAGRTPGGAAGPPSGPARPGPAAASPPLAAPGGSPDGALDSLGAAIEGQVRVIADPPTNALIVIASARDFLAIKDVIRQLDLPRRQVYIETVVLDVDVTANDQLGTVSHAGTAVGQDGSLLVGGVSTSTASSIGTLQSVSQGGLPAGLLTGLLGGPLPGSQALFGQSIPSFAVLFRALADHSNARVVSTPSIIAVDNVEAKYNVGTTIQIERASGLVPLAAGAGAPGFPTSSFDPKELPLTLNIKPHISNDDSVLLEVAYDEQELTGDPHSLHPTWIHRNFATRVVVRDQQTVVLGGLSQERELLSTVKVPLLGDIPLLGYLFKSTTRTKQRTNLVVVLTPYIIRQQADLYAIRERKLREYDEFARSMSGLANMAFQPDIDYRKKRGLLEEINRAVLDAEHDAAARTAVDTRPPGVAAGSVEPPRPPDQ